MTGPVPDVGPRDPEERPAVAFGSGPVQVHERAEDGVAPLGETPAAGVAQAGTSRRAARNVVAVMTSEVLGKAATVAFTVVVARELGATDFGSFSYALAFGTLLATFISWGFDSEVLRRGSTDRRDLGVVLGQALTLRAFHALPIVAIGGVAGVLTRPSAPAAVALVLVLLAAVLDSYGDSGRTAATAIEQAGMVSFALVVQRVAACVLAAAALALGGGLVAVCVGYLASSVVGLAALATLLHRLGVRPRLRGQDRAGLAGMWRSTFVLGVDAVLGVALFRVDALILGALAGDREVAAYTVGYRLMETVLFVTWAVSRSLFPAMVRAGGGRPLVQVAENALAVAAAVLTPYGLLMLLEGGQIIRLLFGSSYGAESTTSLQWLAFAPLAFALNYFCGYVLFVRGRKSWLLLGTVFALLVNVALNVLLIPMFEARGAAFATTASYLVEGVLNIVLVARCAGLFRLHRSLLLSVGACVPMAAALLLLDAPLGVEVAAGGLLYVLAYMLLVRWRDPGQLALLRSLVTRS